jgi:hypothetical protein
MASELTPEEIADFRREWLKFFEDLKDTQPDVFADLDEILELRIKELAIAGRAISEGVRLAQQFCKSIMKARQEATDRAAKAKKADELTAEAQSLGGLGYNDHDGPGAAQSEPSPTVPQPDVAATGERMRDTIDVEEYCAAFTTWASVFKLDDTEKRCLEDGLTHLRIKFSGVQEIQDLCNCLYDWEDKMLRGKALHLRLSIDKSCLLHRLIYSGEKLRERPCPTHKGQWSGCREYPCPEGCGYGSNITGWLPNETVSESGDKPKTD